MRSNPRLESLNVYSSTGSKAANSLLELRCVGRGEPAGEAGNPSRRRPVNARSRSPGPEPATALSGLTTHRLWDSCIPRRHVVAACPCLRQRLSPRLRPAGGKGGMIAGRRRRSLAQQISTCLANEQPGKSGRDQAGRGFLAHPSRTACDRECTGASPALSGASESCTIAI